MAPRLSREHSIETAPSEQRSALLAAALRLLREQGASGLKLRTVAAAAGCSTTGVYTWFGGKHGLVEALFVEAFDRFGVALRSGRRARSPQAEVRALGRRYRAWAVANPTHYGIMFGGLVPGFVPSAQASAFALTTFTVLVDAVREAIECGEFAPGDPTAVAYHLWAGMHGYVELELAGRHRLVSRPPGPLFDRGMNLLMDGVRG
jgi:AcrR family transcriptional regulator